MENNSAMYNQDIGVDSILAQLDYKGNLKFRFSALLHSTVGELRDYGNVESIKMLDAHILKDIDEHPGILSVELAQSWCRARSAISVIVAQLEKRGYIRKERSETNRRELALYTTEAGHTLCDFHRKHDALAASNTINELLQFCTPAEIDAYFKVLEYQIKVIQERYKKESGSNT